MSIHKATYEDIPELEKLINSAYRGDTSKKGWTTEADLLSGTRTDAHMLREMMSRENASILKYCKEDNGIEGCVYLEKKADKMYVGLLTVSPMLQAKGIGKKLLFAAEEHALEHKCFVMQMTVISLRDELINWYERHGYHKTGEKQPFPLNSKFGVTNHTLEFIVLEKSL